MPPIGDFPGGGLRAPPPTMTTLGALPPLEVRLLLSPPRVALVRAIFLFTDTIVRRVRRCIRKIKCFSLVKSRTVVGLFFFWVLASFSPYCVYDLGGGDAARTMLKKMSVAATMDGDDRDAAANTATYGTS